MKLIKTFEVFSYFDMFKKAKIYLDNRNYKDFKKEININVVSQHNNNLLFYSVSEFDLNSFNFLIDNGININFHNTTNNILTFIASKYYYHPEYSSFYIEALYKVLKYDVDWNFIRNGRKKQDFLEILKEIDYELYNNIINKYPIKYKNYLLNKQLNKYNI